MRMELIQPFINSADAVLSETLATPVSFTDISMEPESYRRHARAALIELSGDIEGRIIFDIEDAAALQVAHALAGGEVEADATLLNETVNELANLVVGNAVTALNDQGFRFKVHPPQPHAAKEGFCGNEEIEALVLDFASPTGSVYMNIAIRYNRRRRADR